MKSSHKQPAQAAKEQGCLGTDQVGWRVGALAARGEQPVAAAAKVRTARTHRRNALRLREVAQPGGSRAGCEEGGARWRLGWRGAGQKCAIVMCNSKNQPRRPLLQHEGWQVPWLRSALSYSRVKQVQQGFQHGKRLAQVEMDDSLQAGRGKVQRWQGQCRRRSREEGLNQTTRGGKEEEITQKMGKSFLLHLEKVGRQQARALTLAAVRHGPAPCARAGPPRTQRSTRPALAARPASPAAPPKLAARPQTDVPRGPLSGALE